MNTTQQTTKGQTLKSRKTGAIKVHMKEHEWFNCYSNGWSQQDITPAAFAHPAKFAKGLIQRIYDHLLTEGYVQAGDTVADPFGGVGLGALFAMRNGLHWTGVELEERFVELGNENIALWNGRFAAHFPGWGTARLLQGDSRFLASVLEGAGVVVSSPPYAEIEFTGSRGQQDLERVKNKVAAGLITGRELSRIAKQGRFSPNENANNLADYGRSPGQLGNMSEGSHTAVISSPPFSPPGNQPTGRGQGVREDYRNGTRKEDMPDSDYGGSNGQLGSMPMTDFDAVISSPAYGDSVNGVGEGPGARHDFKFHNGSNATKKSNDNGYGETAGNLGNMAAVVGSPPYFETHVADSEAARLAANGQASKIPDGARSNGIRYGQTAGQLGTETADTFWSSAAAIVAQCYQTLRPGGVAAWVTGDYVRDSKRVEFGRQWLQLCESVGFIPLEHITAWKREPGPVQTGIFGDDKDLTVDRVSFFRRLSNRKNPEQEIVNEDVWIVQKPIFATNGRAKETL